MTIVKIICKLRYLILVSPIILFLLYLSLSLGKIDSTAESIRLQTIFKRSPILSYNNSNDNNNQQHHNKQQHNNLQQHNNAQQHHKLLFFHKHIFQNIKHPDTPYSNHTPRVKLNAESSEVTRVSLNYFDNSNNISNKLLFN